MGKILHFKAICNHEVAMIQENFQKSLKYIVQDYSLVKSETKTEIFSTFSEAFAKWNEVCTKIIEEA